MDKHLKGSLEIICGSMFSGKSEELIRRLKRAQIAQRNVLVFKPIIDNRHHIEYVSSHNGSTIKAIPVDHPETIFDHIDSTVEVIGIDEIQFFQQEILNVVCTLVDQGKRVLAAGLDLDFRQMPFGPMPLLLAIADYVTKLKAICMICGKDAHFSQRLVDHQPARYDDPIVMVGAQEKYQARCRNCYKIDKQPTF